MIDKLDLRARAFSILRPQVSEYIRTVNSDEFSHRVRPSAHYAGKLLLATWFGPLRQFNLAHPLER